jgi:hypothetical protein
MVMGEPEPSPRELIARAVEQGLEPEERQKVTAWLLERSFGTRLGGHPIGIGTAIGSAIATEQRERLLEVTFGGGSSGGRRGEHQVVPIRLPTDQHAALRDWCQEHGFTMATVVRGLVERFLEDQGQPPAKSA